MDSRLQIDFTQIQTLECVPSLHGGRRQLHRAAHRALPPVVCSLNTAVTASPSQLCSAASVGCTWRPSVRRTSLQRTHARPEDAGFETGVQRVDNAQPVPSSREKESAAAEASTSGSDDDDSEGGRHPLFLRLVRVVVLGIPRSLISFVMAVSRLLVKRRSKWDMLILALILLATLPLFPGSSARSVSSPQEVMYSDFRKLTADGFVKSVRIDESANQIYFNVPVAPREQQKRTWIPGRRRAAPQQAAVSDGSARQDTLYMYTKRIRDPDLIPALMAAGVQFGAVKSTMTGAVMRLVGTVMGLWIPLLPLIFIMRQALGGRSGSKAKNQGGKGAKAPQISFQDVAGVDSAKAELLEVVQCLKDAARYTRLNARMPSGVLLCGPPGTGKTLLAKAVAGEAGVPFFAAAASEFVEMYVGRGAARVRDLFAEARKRAPCVVFIDELDAVGGRRGIGLNEERDQTLNQLLTELDGFESRTGVLLLAATNRPEVLDAALMRPGRLSRKVIVPLPDEGGRAQILAVHLRNTPMASMDAKRHACAMVAKLTSGMSGAELANVCNEAALLAGRRSAEVVELVDLCEAVQRTRHGVNGAPPSFLPASWQKRLNESLVNILSSSRQMRPVPTSL